MSKKRGLPQDKKMRHTEHFIDTLFSRDDNAIGKMIPIEAILVNVDQPRKSMGELDGLIQSIQNYGILEPLLVEPAADGRYKIIAGERRYHAAVACGLSHLPCLEIPIENEAQGLELALIENLQRQDLDPFEEAFAYTALQEKYGYTHEIIAQKIGKKRSTVTEIMSIAELPEEIRDLCRHADITAKSILLEVAKASDLMKMREMIDAIMDGKGREAIRRIRKENLPKAHFGFYEAKSENSPINLKIRIGGENIPKEEIISFLRSVIKRIERDGLSIKSTEKAKPKKQGADNPTFHD